jgi:hypothetical protein
LIFPQYFPADFFLSNIADVIPKAKEIEDNAGILAKYLGNWRDNKSADLES